MDEHSKLARIAINIPPGADAAFRINVSKMSVLLPAEIRPALRTLLSGLVGQAQDAYRQRVQLVPPTASEEVDEAAVSPEGQEWRLGDNWTRVVEVLESELRDQPELLQRVLTRLAAAPAASELRAAR